MATEMRFAFALNGGVSLAIWIGGVGDEVLRFIDGGRRAANGEHDDTNPYIAICHELDVLPKVDVLTGSSAGGLNAAFLGCAIAHRCPNLEPIRQLWLDHGSFDRLLRRHTDSALISVLNGDENFLPHIEEAFNLLAKNGTGYTDVDPPVTVRLTATSLAGRVTTISDGHGHISSVDHRVEFVFGTSDFDFAADDKAILRLARACRSTASFPGAFEPSNIPVDLYESRHVTGGLFDGVTAPTVPVIDGAVLVNLPAQSAIEAIVHQPSSERVERVLALVVPDPGELSATRDGLPTLNEVLSKSIVGIPRTQSLTDFVRELDEHNLEVRSRRAARDSLLAQFATQAPAAAWADLANVADTLFPSYQATRVMTSVARMRLGIPARMPKGSPPVQLATLDDIDPDVLPWVANDLAPGGSDSCWGSAPVRRLAAVVITWINTVAAAADPDVAGRLYAVKQRISAARTDADRISPRYSIFEGLFAEELIRDGSDVPAALERACRLWPSPDPVQASADIAALNQRLASVASCFDEFIELARPIIEDESPDTLDPKAAKALNGLLQLHDGAAASPDGMVRLLLCVEVIEATFAGSEPRPDQLISLIQFTAKGAATIDPLQRSTPMDKLAGVELAHFGAFLKRSWRANDWMWGRVDAAERLVRLLDSMLANRLSDAGTLETHIRAVQAEVLRQELPTVLAEIEADDLLGARSCAEGKAFCAAVRKMVGTPQGPVELSLLTEAQVQELLGLQLVGSEDLEMEVGSKLSMMMSISALATIAGVLRAQGPRLLRGPIGLIGASSSVAWRIAQRRRGDRLRAIEASMIIVIGLIGLVGTAIDLFTGVDLGAFRYVAWACIPLALVLCVFAVPWLLVRVGRRAMGRPRPH
ncbi:MAG: patatin-like protein [Pseudonocardiales bacterium]